MYLNGRMRGQGIGAIGPYGSLLWWLWATPQEREAAQIIEAQAPLPTPKTTPPAPITEPLLTQWTPAVMQEAAAQRQAGFVQASTPLVITPGAAGETPWLLYGALAVGGLALLLLVTRR